MIIKCIEYRQKTNFLYSFRESKTAHFEADYITLFVIVVEVFENSFLYYLIFLARHKYNIQKKNLLRMNARPSSIPSQ